ncbi:MAG: 8-oxoguanine deaminase [Ardenticatenales bacterium]|nr:8-oxoguanine deaminase [Ardenticatenales bacterium]
MSLRLFRHAALIGTMDEARREIPDGALVVRDREIVAVGPTEELVPEWEDQVERITDVRDMILLPGLVNTHHHLYQTLTRAVPAAQNAKLFDWLVTHYPIWAGLTSEAIYISALTGLAELMLSGCTTASDHLYLYPNDCDIEDEIRAAQELGIRFHPTRGSMSLGESQGGLPPDRVTEDEATILKKTQQAIERWNEPDRFGMVRVGVAPCSPFSVTPDLMRESAALARSYGVGMHTHLAETLDEETFCLERFGQRPAEYAASLGWTGEEVWWAHSVHVNPAEIAAMAATGTGMSHCPSSNMRLASGIAPIRAMRDANVKVSLGVDGSASNDGCHLLGEARQAMLLQRVLGQPDAMTAREALELATLGGAAVLGRTDIGALAPGMAADVIGFRLDRLEYAGAYPHDPLAALIFCYPRQADMVMINGRLRVDHGELLGWELGKLVERHNELARALVEKTV